MAPDAVAFVNTSRSIRASAKSWRSRLTSASTSGTERAPGAAPAEDALAVDPQFLSVAFGSDSRVAAGPSDSPW